MTTAELADPMRTCPECGSQNPAASRFCFCGADLDAPPRVPVRGVGGWLLFFCIQLVVLAPVISLLSIASLVNVLAARGLLGSNVGSFFLAQNMPSLLVVTFGVIVGIALWREAPGALRLVRVYLVLLASAPFIAALLPVIWPIPAQVALRAGQAGVLSGGFSVFGAVIWWLYFSSSRRVRFTYREKGGP